MKHVLHNYELKDKKSIRKFVTALDRATNKHGKTVRLTCPIKEIRRDEIKDFFKAL